MSKYKFIKNHNNYNLKLGKIYECFEYSRYQLMIKNCLYERDCFEKISYKNKYKKVSELDSCPFCGHNEFYIKQRYWGNCNGYARFDGGDVENSNSEMFNGTQYKTTSKFAYCGKCNKKIAELDDSLI